MTRMVACGFITFSFNMSPVCVQKVEMFTGLVRLTFGSLLSEETAAVNKCLGCNAGSDREICFFLI